MLEIVKNMSYNMTVPEKRVQKIQPFKIAFSFSFDGLIISYLAGFVNMKTHICEILRGADNITTFSYYRKRAGVKQVTIAKKLNVNQGAVSHWETGKNKPTAKYLPRLAKLFGCTVDELMGDVADGTD